VRRTASLLVVAAASVLAASGAASIGCHHESAPPNPSGSTTPTLSGSTTPTAEIDAAVTVPDAADAGETVVSVEDDGKTFDLPPGGTLTFRLASHSGTGFVWKPAPLDGGVLAGVGERTTEVSSAVPGAPKMDIYRFVARSAGTTVIEMSYQRPWGHQPPVKTVRVTVTVR
jgi:predicted secreted protein